MSQPVELPRWADIGLLPLVNLALALVVCAVVLAVVGLAPGQVLLLLVKGAFGSAAGLSYTLYYATTFIFTGLAVAVAFHAGLFNIGGEGQAMLGGLGCSLVALSLGAHAPALVVLPLMVLAAAVFGGLWAALPAALQAWRGSHIVITTIMFNWLAATLMAYLLVNVMRLPTQMNPETPAFPVQSQLPKLDGLFTALGLKVQSTPLNLSFVMALAASVFVWWLIWRTRLGYEIRVAGTNPTAAVYAGISLARVTIIAMAISGALAGGLAVNELMGVQHRLLLEFTAGYGFVGLAVALIGRGHPAGIVLASILFGMLYQGGAELAFDKPKISRDMIIVIQGLVVLFAGALEGLFRRPLSRWLAPRREAA